MASNSGDDWVRRPPASWPDNDETVEDFAARRARKMAMAEEAKRINDRQKAEQQAAEAAALLQKQKDELAKLVSGGFVAFVKRMGVTLSPAQKVLCYVCFDGVQRSQFKEPQQALFDTMFGPVEVIDSTLLRWLEWVIGGRSGKSYLGALALLYRALTADLSSLAPGEEATALIVCPRLELANHTLKFISGACKKHPLLGQFILGKRQNLDLPDANSLFGLRRPDGRVVTFAAMPATAGGGAVRGMTLIAVMLDEVAFFHDDEYTVNDKDIYQAVVARVTIPGGFVLASSTPWAEGGLLYEKYEQNFGHPTTGVCANVSTSLMRSDNPIILNIVATERRSDPRNAEREYDAKFSATASTLYFPGTAITACIRHGESVIDVQPGAHVYIAVDASFSVDSSDRFGWAVATAVASKRSSQTVERRERRLVTIHEAEGWEVDRKPREMAQRLRDEVCARYGTNHVYIDQYSDRAFQQLCSDVGLFAEIVPWKGGEQEDSKSELYRRLRTAMMTEHVALCDSPQLLTDLRTCKSKLMPGGGEQIGVPRTRRGHGDVLSAAVQAAARAMDAPAQLVVPEAPEDMAQRLAQERLAEEKRKARKLSEKEAKRTRVTW